MMPLVSSFRALASVFALAACACLAGGEASLLNPNANMELGFPGPGVPGWKYRIVAMKSENALADVDKLYIPRASPDGKSGQCLFIPGWDGVVSQQLFIEPLYINEDCDIEISFDAKIGPDAKGKTHPAGAYQIHFRCNGDESVSTKSAYPVMKSFPFAPESEWKTFVFKAKAIAWRNNYYLALLCNSPETESAPNSLYLDNFRIKAGSSALKLEDEIASVPDRPQGVYFGGETIKFKLRALLNSDAKKAVVSVSTSFDHDGSPAWTRSVELERSGTVDEKEGARGIYEGAFEVKADAFGAFSQSLSIDGRKLRSVGGDFVVLHQPVLHKKLTPGWLMGSNFDGYQYMRASDAAQEFMSIEYGSLDSYARLFRQGGLNLIRYWFKWKVVEPKEGEFTTKYFQADVSLMKKYDLALILCLGEWKISAPRKAGDLSRIDLPEHVCKYARKRAKNPDGLWIWPPDDVYKSYLGFLLKNWSSDVDVWEFLNEPGMGDFDAENWTSKDYLARLKLTFDEVKKARKDAIVLGNGVTTDFGSKAENWCSDLMKADPSYESYLDGVAFHPYAAALDCQNGEQGRYARLAEKIRAFLPQGKPLWDTECYYLPDHRQKQIQFYTNLGRYGASEIQRHMLDGFQHGVLGVASMAQESLFKFKIPVASTPVPGEVFAGTNALSFLLKDMERLETLSFNKFVKAGIFLDSKGEKGLGFVYDQRPGGSTWKIPEELSGVKVVDLFGNPVKAGGTLTLGLHPVYLLGSPERIRSLLKPESFAAKNALKLFARAFRDELHLEAVSGAGQTWVADVVLSSNGWLKAPETVQFAFADGVDSSCAALKNAVAGAPGALSWKAFNKGEPAGEGVVELLPPVGAWDLPFGDAKPLELTLGRGSKAWLFAGADALHVKVETKDANLIPAKDGKALWSGSALEVFIDSNPFSRLDSPGTRGMSVSQFIFAALPSVDGKEAAVIRVEKEEGSAFDSGATRVVEKTSDGYILSASIPWSEIKSRSSASDVFGMDLELDSIAPDGAKKESLGAKPGSSFKERLHYPLFKLPPEIVEARKAAAFKDFGAELFKNSSFRLQSGGKPDNWIVGVAEGAKIEADSERGLLVSVPEGSDLRRPSSVLQRMKLKPGAVKKVLLRALVKMDGVKKAEPSQGEFKELRGLHLWWGFRKDGKPLGNTGFRSSEEGFLGTRGWTLLQFWTDVPGEADEIDVSAGLKGGCVGSLNIDHLEMEVW